MSAYSHTERFEESRPDDSRAGDSGGDRAFLQAIESERFLSEYVGRKVFYACAAANTAPLLTWARLNEALDAPLWWTDRRLQLVRNGDTVDPQYYCDVKETYDGQRSIADPAKVRVFTSMGATLIANEIQQVVPALHRCGQRLAELLGGSVGANAYASPGTVQGFDTHFDLHEVFAIQCEGQKRWRLYQNVADNPIAYPNGPPGEVRDWFMRTRGALAREVVMKPGDVLYLPRGTYHEACAESGASLHVTFSVTPPDARLLFKFIEQAALEDSLFRAYLPRSGASPDALRERLVALGERLRDIVSSPDLVRAVAKAQAAIVRAPKPYNFPERDTLQFYRTTKEKAVVTLVEGRYVLRSSQGSLALDGDTSVILWMLERPGFALQEVAARFPDATNVEIEKAASALTALGVIAPAPVPK